MCREYKQMKEKPNACSGSCNTAQVRTEKLRELVIEQRNTITEQQTTLRKLANTIEQLEERVQELEKRCRNCDGVVSQWETSFASQQKTI